MIKKMLVILFLAAFILPAFSANIWTGSGNNDLWTNPDNWDGSFPDTTNQLKIQGDGEVAMVVNGDDITVSRMLFMDGSTYNDTSTMVNYTGGDFKCNGYWYVANCITSDINKGCEINISGKAYVETPSMALGIGTASGNSKSVVRLNITDQAYLYVSNTGGDVYRTSGFVLPGDLNKSVMVRVEITGNGVLQVNNLVMGSNEDVSINIGENGSLRVAGNKVTELNTLIANNQIFVDDMLNEPVVAYNGVDTYVVSPNNALLDSIAVWNIPDYDAGTVTYLDDSICGLRANVLSWQSTSIDISKDENCGVLIFDNTLSDSTQTNTMLKVNDSDILTGHDNGNGFESLTIEVEFKPDTLKQCQLVRKTEGSTNTGYQLYMSPEGRVGLYLGGSNGYGAALSRNSVETGKWHKVIATWENQFQYYNTQVIVDGIVTRGSPDVGTLTNTTGPLTIGGLYRSSGDYGQFFDGEIRNVSITTNRARLLDVRGACDPETAIYDTSSDLESQDGYESSEFLYSNPPYPECHASTIVDLGSGNLAAAWFGGTCEGHIDVGIWFTKYNGTSWSEPVMLAQGPMLFPERDTLFNPLLFKHSTGKLMLFYKIGVLGSSLKGRLLTSNDNGSTWSQAIDLPSGIYGPSKNKPVELSDGSILCPSDNNVQITTVIADFADIDDWDKYTYPNPNDYEGVIQSTILFHSSTTLQALFRTMEDKIAQSYSYDSGETWSNISLTTMPSNNSGIDAVTLSDGRHVLVYNHSIAGTSWSGPRTPLNIAVSYNGTDWYAALILEDDPGEYSYPSIIQSSDGLIHVVYTWHRLRIKHVVLDPDDFTLTAIVNGVWP
ncbi:MAG: exo-alpha-sialidase [Sedimentisphaeraceae bacterium JB056]